MLPKIGDALAILLYLVRNDAGYSLIEQRIFCLSVFTENVENICNPFYEVHRG